MSLAERAVVPEVVLTLNERRERIYERLSAAALDIGNELIAAKRDHRLSFTSWVEAEMPWSLDVAERLMAVARTFASATPEQMAALPRPYSTLYELTKLDPDRLQRAIEVGEVTPKTTHRQAVALAREVNEVDNGPDIPVDKNGPEIAQPQVSAPTSVDTPPVTRKVTDADLHALGLLRQKPSDLRPELADELRKWLPDTESA